VSLQISAPPGAYTVKLSAGGRELTQPLTVSKDPNSGGSEAEIEAQMHLLFDLREFGTDLQPFLFWDRRAVCPHGSLSTNISIANLTRSQSTARPYFPHFAYGEGLVAGL
jgi:hypothetical protein